MPVGHAHNTVYDLHITVTRMQRPMYRTTVNNIGPKQNRFTKIIYELS